MALVAVDVGFGDTKAAVLADKRQILTVKFPTILVRAYLKKKTMALLSE